MIYTFTGYVPQLETRVAAPNEEEARRLAMLARWGGGKDEVVPHAPDYKGTGLALVSVEREPRG